MTSRSLRVFAATVTVVAFSFLVGCMPEAQAPSVEGPLDTATASQLQAKVRSQQGNKYSVEHEYNGQPFTAEWELGNALKKTSQLQLKPPAEWSDVDLYQALGVVLQAHETKPWYSQIDDTALSLTRRAIKSDDGVASDFAPETPYEVAVKVKQHSTEWFLQVKVLIYNDDGTAFGF